jgi:hypothetical protein
MLELNKIFELFYPIWMILSNGLLAIIYCLLFRFRFVRSPAVLLSTGSLCFVIVNATYTLVNWSSIFFIKKLLICFGPILLVTQILFGILGSLLFLLGSLLLTINLMNNASAHK